jgi:hypothetical protein
MARQNPALLAFNRGILSTKALARVDLDRTQLSAEVMTNWLPKTQGAMIIRPGTKHLGSSLNDSGAEWIEFVASTDDAALLELTHKKLRVWIDDALLARPDVNTTVSLSDTGWSNTSTGGLVVSGGTPDLDNDVIPKMDTGPTFAGVTITASGDSRVLSGVSSGRPWRAADDTTTEEWLDTGQVASGTFKPSWWKINFGTDTGNRKAVLAYSIRAGSQSNFLNKAPQRWQLIASNFDTGTFAIDTGKWRLEDTQGSETGWATNERRFYTLPGADTGTVEPRRYWRLSIKAVDGGPCCIISEIEMFEGQQSSQAIFKSGHWTLNPTSIGALAQIRKRVVVSDTGTEHSLDIHVSRGPVTLRVGTADAGDDLISETVLGTGYHNLAFTPQSTHFHILFQSSELADRIINSLQIGDSGIVQIETPWETVNLDDVRYDQSADVIYVDCDTISPRKIERRGTGRSWSVVEYQPNDGPFRPAASSNAKLSVSHKYGNTKLNSDLPFFRNSQVGALMRLFTSGQSGLWPLGAKDAATDAVQVTGISDTGAATGNSEREVSISVAGTWSGTAQVERSFDGPDIGFHPATPNFMANAAATDTGTFTRTVHDKDDNITAWYRVRLTAYTSGVALVTIAYKGGGVNGIARITGHNSSTDVNIEVLSRFSDTGPTDSWQEGEFSGRRGFPTAVSLYSGRLGHAKKATLFLSASDDYENFDDEQVGDAAPIIRTLGSGPVDSIVYLLALLRLVIGTSGAEIELRSSSLDEPVTPDNSNARIFSTQGSANLRALRLDTKGIFVQRSGQRMFMIGAGLRDASAFGEYSNSELTMLVPDLLEAGIVSVAIQRQPDTRIHAALANGKVGILTYEPDEEVLCWSMWETDGAVERVMVLPGTNEDAVYYHVNRTINGATKRFLERWALESETKGDTGLTFLMDCAKQGTTNGTAIVSGFAHLAGEALVAVAQDTGQVAAMRDLSPDTAGIQKTYLVDTGAGTITLDTGNFTNVVAGLPYTATYKSTKLAYAAEAGTALAQMKRTDKIGFVLHRVHNNALFFGNDTGKLDALPRKIDGGALVNPDKIFDSLDQVAVPFPGLWDADSRIVLRAKSPRPVTVMAAVPTVGTSERV